MTSLVRGLLICLIALALPVQGIAAATLRFCGTGHEPPARVVDSAAHGHHAANRLATAPAADGAGQAAEGAQAGHLKCSVCAACCMGSALPASPLTLPVVEPVVEPSAPVPARYVGPDRTGLERPPKPELA